MSSKEYSRAEIRAINETLQKWQLRPEELPGLRELAGEAYDWLIQQPDHDEALDAIIVTELRYFDDVKKQNGTGQFPDGSEKYLAKLLGKYENSLGD